MPAYGGRVPRTAAERIKGLKGNGALAVLVVSYGNRDYDDTLIELYDVVKAQGFTCVSGVTAIAEHSIMHQFASGRPDTDDINQLKTFAKEVKAKIDASRLTEVQVKGNRPYKELKEVPFHPTASDSCTMCGLCAKLCPVHAIPFEAPNQTNGEQCISCMRCVQVCPSKARHIDEQMLSAVSEKNETSICPKKRKRIVFVISINTLLTLAAQLQ